MTDIENFRVGVTTYENFYTNEELKNMEKHVEETEEKSMRSKVTIILYFFRRISTDDSIKDILRKHSQKNKILLRIQIYVDQNLAIRTIK
jgi:hypothetical protein